MTQFTRRTLVRTLLGLASYLPVSLLLAAPTGSASPEGALRALGPYLDTLLPEDSTPSATQLGVDRAFLERARANKRFEKFLTLGCRWLDRQAMERGADEFALLGQAAQIAIVAKAEQAKSRTLPRAFFNQTRSLAFHHYYAQAASWNGMGYAGPPQPSGFPDFAQPPSMDGP